MAQASLSICRIREVLRLKAEARFIDRQIAAVVDSEGPAATLLAPHANGRDRLVIAGRAPRRRDPRTQCLHRGFPMKYVQELRKNDVAERHQVLITTASGVLIAV